MVKKLAKVSRSSSCKPLSKGSPIFELRLTFRGFRSFKSLIYKYFLLALVCSTRARSTLSSLLSNIFNRASRCSLVLGLAASWGRRHVFAGLHWQISQEREVMPIKNQAFWYSQFLVPRKKKAVTCLLFFFLPTKMKHGYSKDSSLPRCASAARHR